MKFRRWTNKNSEILPLQVNEVDSAPGPRYTGPMPRARRVLASHHVIELEGCRRSLCDSPALVGFALTELCRSARLKVVRRARHEFTPHGLTVLYVLAESHLAYSSWPERRYAVLDLFLCGEAPGLAAAVDRFARTLGAKRVRRRRFTVGPFA